jgi:hypothetical protein
MFGLQYYHFDLNQTLSAPTRPLRKVGKFLKKIVSVENTTRNQLVSKLSISLYKFGPDGPRGILENRLIKSIQNGSGTQKTKCHFHY